MNNNRGANSCQALATLQAMFTAAANSTSMAIFKGVAPDLDTVVAQLGTGNTINCTQLTTALGATSDNCLAVFRFPLLTPTFDPAMNVWRVGLSALTANVPGLASGVPTYAIIRTAATAQAADTFASFINPAGASTPAAVTNVLLATVGSESSDAELRILGGQIVSGQSYRMTDLQFSL